MRMIKAIQIDPFTCTVNEVEYDASDYQNIYPLLSHPAHPVDTFTVAPVDMLKDGDALFVDDEGLFKNPQRWFQIAGWHEPLAGMGLIIGNDKQGDSRSCKTSLNLVRMSVVFLELFGHRLIQARGPYEAA